MSKLSVIATANEDREITFCLHNEDHTLGGALRHMIARNPAVDLVGYTLPHPSEDKIHLRIQAREGTAVDALRRGLDDLDAVCEHILACVDAEMGTSAYVPIYEPLTEDGEAMDSAAAAAAAAAAAGGPAGDGAAAAPERKGSAKKKGKDKAKKARQAAAAEVAAAESAAGVVDDNDDLVAEGRGQGGVGDDDEMDES